MCDHHVHYMYCVHLLYGYKLSYNIMVQCTANMMMIYIIMLFIPFQILHFESLMLHSSAGHYNYV